MLYPPENWHVDPDFLEFKQLVKKIAVVNDAGERAVKAAEEIVNQVKDEKKMQKMLIVKSKLKKRLIKRQRSSKLLPSNLIWRSNWGTRTKRGERSMKFRVGVGLRKEVAWILLMRRRWSRLC